MEIVSREVIGDSEYFNVVVGPDHKYTRYRHYLGLWWVFEPQRRIHVPVPISGVQKLHKMWMEYHNFIVAK